MIRTDPGKNDKSTSSRTVVFSQHDPEHVRHVRHRDLANWSDLAATLARGYLRLTQKSRNVAVSRREIPHKELDVLAGVSVHVDGSDGEDGPPWKAV